jgi:hypothetical protein
MRFKVYLSIFSGVLLLGLALSHFRDTTHIRTPLFADPDPRPRFRQAAARFADRLQIGNVAEWQVYGDSLEMIYVDGKDSHGIDVLKVVFARSPDRPYTIVCFPNGANQVNGLFAKTSRAMAVFWLRRLEGNDANRYAYIRDGIQGRAWSSSRWRSPTRCLNLAINPRTGQLLYIRFLRYP